MRIGVDVRELQRGTRTGIGRMVEAFIAEAPPLSPNARFFLYADKSTRTGFEGEHTEVRVLGQPATIWFDQVALPRALAKDRVDVFLSPYYKAPVAAPCPFAVTVHDISFLKMGDKRVKNMLFRPWARLIASRAAVVLTDSEHSRRDLEETLGLDPSWIEVIPLGVSSRFSPKTQKNAPALASRLGIRGDYVLSVTNFRPHKNDRLLLSAFADLAAREPDLTLVLAGRPAASNQKLMDWIHRLDLKGRVVLPGLVPDEDLPALYSGARVFAFPSLYEGFGLPVLEAFASGTPVACSSSSSLPEVASDAALLLDPRDKEAWTQGLRRLLTDQRFRRTLIEAGLARARDFSWRHSAATILSTLERVARK